MKKFIKYITVGGSAFITEYFTFVILMIFSGQILIAQVVSWCVGYAVSFFGHRQLTFKDKPEYKFSKSRQFVMYGITAIATLLASTMLVYLFSMIIAPLLAKLVAMTAVATLSYFILNKLVFVR